MATVGDLQKRKFKTLPTAIHSFNYINHRTILFDN